MRGPASQRAGWWDHGGSSPHNGGAPHDGRASTARRRQQGEEIDECDVRWPDRSAGQTLLVAARTPPAGGPRRQRARGAAAGRRRGGAAAGARRAPGPGLPMFVRPCGCPTPARHPVSFAWQTQSTTDRAQIERWARHQPQANFITATGMVNDVLDVPWRPDTRRWSGCWPPASRSARSPRATTDGCSSSPSPAAPRGRGRVVAVRTGLPPRDDGRTPRPALALPRLLRPGPPAQLPGENQSVHWVRGPEHPCRTR